MLAILLSLAALAGEFTWELPARPPIADAECAQAIDLVPGQPLPPGLLDSEGNVRCHATIVPTSQLAELILVDVWARQAAPRGRQLTAEAVWHEQRYAALLDAYQRPEPKLQRALGRVEGALAVVAAVGIYVAIDAAAGAAR